MAGEGAVCVYRQSAGGAARNSTSWVDCSFDTPVKESDSSTIEAQGTGPYIDFRLKRPGIYVVSTIQGLEDDSGSLRSNVRIKIDNSPYESECENGYLRRAQGAVTAYGEGLSFVKVTRPINIRVRYIRSDSNSLGTTKERANKSSISILYLGDLSWAVTSPGTTLYSAGTSWANRSWPSLAIADSGFTFNSGTIRADVAGTYLLWNSLPLENLTAIRMGVSSRFTANGSIKENSYGHSYVKGTTDGCERGAVGNISIVKTTGVNQLLYVQHYREGGAMTSKAGGVFAAIKLPDDVKVISVHHSGAGSSFDTGGTALPLDTQDFIDTDIFTHDPVTNNSRVGVDLSGDYFFLAGIQGYRAGGTNIFNNQFEWRSGGVGLYPYGSFGTFSRGAAHLTSGCSFAEILPGLVSGDYVELFMADESISSGTAPAVVSDKSGICALQISSLGGGQSVLDFERMHRGVSRGLIRGAV